jgi:aspartyl protease family protein
MMKTDRGLGHSTAAVALGLLGCFWFGVASATDVSVVGLFSSKAVIMVNGGAPRTVEVGAKTPEGVKLIGVDQAGATVEVDGKRYRVAMGQGITSSAGSESALSAATLTADGRGHFVAAGTVNGAPVRFLVDTGATVVSMGAGDAIRAGIDFRNQGQPAMTMTANGPAQVWRVKLRDVRVGDLVLNDVDGAVHSIDMPVVLLGMSFLNRMEMKREGSTMTLRKRF